jgi:hypothetical protein
MSSEFGLIPTGHELIDALQNLQKVADHIDHDEQKIDHIRQAIGLLSARTLLGGQFMVSALQVLGLDPDTAPNDRVLFNQNMIFIAELDSFGYLLDNSVPVDCLSLNFLHPEVIGLDLIDERKIKEFTFQVPVLAIESCVAA